MTAALRVDPPESTFSPRRLEQVFRECFLAAENTELLGGAAEPLYQPAAMPRQCHRLYYREDYFASALHECAHWCIAGAQRRLLPDFGYWYAPEGRSPAQQRAFEAVESKPQALEWYFSRACGHPFRVSADNLDPDTGSLPDNRDFCLRVQAQALHWRSAGLPPRAAVLYTALASEFGTTIPAGQLEFPLAELL